MKFWVLTAGVSFGLIIAPFLGAQATKTGHIDGHVVDPMGAIIPGASVFIRRNRPSENNIRLVAHTDAHGDFALALPEGGYDILVVAPGFAAKVETRPIWPGKTTKTQWKLVVLGCDFPGMNCDTFR